MNRPRIAQPEETNGQRPLELLFAFAVGLCLLWVFWPSLGQMAVRWIRDVEYSHGFMVPLFSVYVLWARRGMLGSEPVQSSWWGLLILAAGLALRFAGTYSFFDWLTAASIVPSLAGLVVLAGGWRALHWSWPALAFLLFMIPVPYRVEVALAQPLQRVAAVSSTYVLQTLGFMAISEGNVIRLGDTRIGVVEACSGLSMLLIFFALATAVTLVVKRPWPEKAVIMISALPVAIIANVIRITATGILHKVAGPKMADLVFHDLAGWLMMPLALVLMWAELKLMSWVIAPTAKPQRGPIPLAIREGKDGRNAASLIIGAKA
jgi:exosortase